LLIVCMCVLYFLFFFSSRRRHTRFSRDWSSDVCSSDLLAPFLFSLQPWSEALLQGLFDKGGQFRFAHGPNFGGFRLTIFEQDQEIGRASCRERSRFRGSRDEYKKNEN